jgi:hypothetical protein
MPHDAVRGLASHHGPLSLAELLLLEWGPFEDERSQVLAGWWTRVSGFVGNEDQLPASAWLEDSPVSGGRLA